MIRREFLAMAGTFWISSALGQRKPALPLIGWLMLSSRDADSQSFDAFKAGLRDHGLIEGTHVQIEARWAQGRTERLQLLAEELAALKPAVIVVATARVVAAAAKAAPATPIVQATGSDPVAAGFAKSLARPGGYITGMSNLVGDLSEKYLEILLAALPSAKRVGFLIDGNNMSRKVQAEGAHRSAAQYAVDARFAEIRRAEEIDGAIARLTKEGVQAMVVLASPLFSGERRRIADVARAHRLPCIGSQPALADAGFLMSYGADLLIQYRRSAFHVDRILKGARPGDLPFEQPTQFELVLNLKTAQALGIRIPQPLMMRASRVIE